MRTSFIFFFIFQTQVFPKKYPPTSFVIALCYILNDKVTQIACLDSSARLELKVLLHYQCIYQKRNIEIRALRVKDCLYFSKIRLSFRLCRAMYAVLTKNIFQLWQNQIQHFSRSTFVQDVFLSFNIWFLSHRVSEPDWLRLLRVLKEKVWCENRLLVGQHRS